MLSCIGIRLFWRGANVCSFALSADEAEELHWSGAGGTEPVWGAGVEFRGFSRGEEEVVFTEHQTEGAVEDVCPVVSLVRTEFGFGGVISWGEDEFVGLNSTGSAGEWDDGRPVGAGDGPQVDAGVGGARCVDERVESYP